MRGPDPLLQCNARKPPPAAELGGVGMGRPTGQRPTCPELGSGGWAGWENHVCAYRGRHQSARRRPLRPLFLRNHTPWRDRGKLLQAYAKRKLVGNNEIGNPCKAANPVVYLGLSFHRGRTGPSSACRTARAVPQTSEPCGVNLGVAYQRPPPPPPRLA